MINKSLEIIRKNLELNNVKHQMYYVKYKTTVIHEEFFFIIIFCEKGYREYFDTVIHSSLKLAFKKTYNKFIDDMIRKYGSINTKNLFATSYNNFNIISEIKQSIKEKVVNEVSCMAIVYHKTENDIKILTIEDDNNNILFPKGHVENGEEYIETAIRECFEETGVKISKEEFVTQLPSYSYSFNAGSIRMENKKFFDYFKASTVIKKLNVFVFKVESITLPIPRCEERIIYSKWYSIKDLESLLTYEDDKNNLKRIKELLGD